MTESVKLAELETELDEWDECCKRAEAKGMIFAASAYQRKWLETLNKISALRRSLREATDARP